MSNFTNLAIPTPEEYYEEFLKKLPNLSSGASEEAMRYIKPIADYIVNKEVKQPSAASMDTHITFDGEGNPLHRFWSLEGLNSYYEDYSRVYGSIETHSGETYKGELYSAFTWDRYQEETHIGMYYTLDDAKDAVERAIKEGS